MRLKMMGGGGSVDYEDLTASAADVPEGLTFIGNGSEDEQTGTLPNRENLGASPGCSSDPIVPIHSAVTVKTETDTQGNKRIMLAPPLGKYPGTAKAFVGCYPIDLGISSESIANGRTVAGVTGSYGSDSTVSDKDIRNGKVAYGSNGRVVGSAADYGKIIRTIGAGESVALNEGFYGESKVTAKDLASQTPGNLEPGKMLAGQYGYSNGQKISGSIVSYKDYAYATSLGAGNDGTEYWAFNGAPAGYYYNSGNDWAPELRLAKSKVREALNISADNIKKGAVVGGITGTWYGNKKTIAAIAARGFEVSSSEYETYHEESFTMPENGTVYYGGANAGYYHVSKCQILKNGVVIDHRDTSTSDWYSGWRGTMFNKSFSANKGDVIKVVCEQSSGTHGMSCIQAIMVY